MRAANREQLAALLEASKSIEVTPEMREKQRRSFAYGNVAIDNPSVTRAMIDEAAERISTTKS